MRPTLCHSARRKFLRHASLSLAAFSLAPAIVFAEDASASLSLMPGGSGPTVPPDFIGLSYENMQLEDPAFFSPANTGLIEQFRAISPRGVLRLGGNTSEFGYWKPDPATPAPRRVDSPWKAAGEPTAATVFPITPQAVDNLNSFLRATGWSCIYGLNLGYGTPDVDVPEAVYVYKALGPRLQYFQVGNEVDLFKGHLRDPQTWNPESYLQQWLAIARAVQKALPGATFGMPDVAADITWLPKLASLWSSVPDRPRLVSLSHHYYWGGPPSSPQASLENLMKTDPRVAEHAGIARAASRRIGPDITWRMTEGNTVYRGGKYGVSDVFGAALWSADYLLTLMSLGYGGVNLHGGSGHAQAVSVGGVFHGEALMPDPNVPHPKPFYTPIANEGTLAGSGVDGQLNGRYVLEPVGYGMKFVAPFAGAIMIPVRFNPGSVNATAYAARKGGKVLIAIVNKDLTRSLSLTLPEASVLSRLEAPHLDSHEAHIVSSTGNRSPEGRLMIPAHSAVLLQLPG